jgi:ribonuclease-3
MREGALTTLRSQITSAKPLAEIAAACDVGRHLKLGKGERQSGGQERPSNLTDALEAVIGAAYEDGGLDAVETIFDRLFVPYVKSAEQSQHLDNPKGALQELVQQRWKTAPRYHVVTEEGPSHDRLYTVEIRINNHVFGRGTASNKRDAQAEAARNAFPELEGLETLPADVS